MLDIKFVRDNPDAVKENIKKKFQDAKLPLVDEVIEKDAKYRECLKEVESLKAARNKLSKANGPLFGQLKKCDDEAKKAELQAQIDANNAAVKADADKMCIRDRSFASPEDMEKYLDCTPGSSSIMGLANDTENHVQLLMDEDLKAGERCV